MTGARELVEVADVYVERIRDIEQKLAQAVEERYAALNGAHDLRRILRRLVEAVEFHGIRSESIDDVLVEWRDFENPPVSMGARVRDGESIVVVPKGYRAEIVPIEEGP